MKKAFANMIDDGGAAIFVPDDNGKVLRQKTGSVVGGTKNPPPRPPNGTKVFNFVIPKVEPYEIAQVTFARIIVRGGQVVDATKVFGS